MTNQDGGLPIYDQQGNLLENPDTEKGYLKESYHLIHHEAISGVEEIGHWKTLAEYPNGGKDVAWVIDVPGVEAMDAWDEEQPCYVYIPYTQEELDAIEAEKNKPSLEQRLAEAVLALQETQDELRAAREEAAWMREAVQEAWNAANRSQTGLMLLSNAEREQETYAALRAMSVVVRETAQEQAQREGAAANWIIEIGPLLHPWKPGIWALGDVCVEENYPYRCVQSHDSTYTPDWKPSIQRALFSPYHGTDAAHALPYVKPTGAHDVYKAGEWMVYTDGKAYRCKEDTAFSPEEWPKGWEGEEEQ